MIQFGRSNIDIWHDELCNGFCNSKIKSVNVNLTLWYTVVVIKQRSSIFHPGHLDRLKPPKTAIMIGGYSFVMYWGLGRGSNAYFWNISTWSSLIRSKRKDRHMEDGQTEGWMDQRVNGQSFLYSRESATEISVCCICIFSNTDLQHFSIATSSVANHSSICSKLLRDLWQASTLSAA